MADPDAELREVHALDNLLRDGYMATKLDGSSMEKVVIFLGFTGSGKSTATKFILKDPSLKIEEDFQGFCNFVDGDDSIGSSDTHTSKTLYPNVRRDEETGVIFIDCAGFEDSRSPDKDLVASFLNKLVLDSSKELKIVIVENCAKFLLTEDRTAFIKVLKHITTILQNNHRSFRDSIALIATKNNDGRSDEKVIESIKKYLEVTLKYLEKTTPQSQIEIDIIKFLLANQNIAQIKKPAAISEPWNADQQLSSECEHIRDLIFNKMMFAKELEGKFNVTLAAQSKLVLERNNNLEAESNIHTFLENEIIPSLIQIFEKNSKGLNVSYIDVCYSYLARIARFETQVDVTIFFLDQNLDQETIREFQFRVKKAEFLFTVTDNSKIFAEVMTKVLKLYGGCIKLTSHIHEALAKFSSDAIKNLDLTLLKASESLVNLFYESITKTEEFEIAVLLDEYFDKLSAVSNHQEMLNFIEEQGVEKTLIDFIKTILMNFQTPAASDVLEKMHTKIHLLNNKRQDIIVIVDSQRHEFISSLKAKLRQNLDTVLGTLMIYLRETIDSTKDVHRKIQLSKDILKNLDMVDCYENFATLVQKYDSESISGSLLGEMQFQVNVLVKRNEKTDVLEYLHQEMRTCYLNIEASKRFFILLDDIRNESTKYVVICSRKKIVSLMNSLDLENFEEKIISLSKFGFSEHIVSTAIKLKLNLESIHKLASFLQSTLGSQCVNISYPYPSPFHGHFDKSFAMSQVMNEGPPESVHVIAMMASKKLIVNVKWALKNTHVILIAPVIEFVKGATFQLDGEHGDPHSNRKAADSVSSNENGENGLDGNPGFSSGSFSAFALQVINARNLQVNSFGGDGDAGQDGGNGIDGELVEETVESMEEVPIVVDAKWAAIPFVGTVFAGIETIRGRTRKTSKTVKKLTKEPTFGGAGGRAGFGASAGMVQFFIKHEENVKWNVQRTKGNNGKAGVMGFPGRNPMLSERNHSRETGMVRNFFSNFSLMGRSQFASEHNDIDISPCRYRYDKVLILTYLIKEYISLANKIIEDRDTKFINYIAGINLDRINDPLFNHCP